MNNLISGMGSGFALFIPFLAFALANIAANLKKINRSRQFLMLPFALVYCVLAYIFLTRIYNLAYALLNQASSWLGAHEKFGGIADLLRSRLASANLPYWAFYAANTLILTAYLVTKRIVISFLSALFRRDTAVHDAVAGLFYEKDLQSGKWYIRDNCRQARTFLKTFYFAGLVLAALGITLTGQLYLRGLMSAPWYPVFMVILIGEAYFYLNGLTRKEAEKKCTAEEDEAENFCDYSLMRKVLRKLFPDKLNAENTTVNDAAPDIGASEAYLEELDAGESVMEEAYGKYLKGAVEDGLTLDLSYAVSGQRLLNGESVLFSTPFYYDLVPYVTYPMNRTLLRHKKVLIILGRHGSEESVAQWAQDGLSAVTHVPELWRIGVLNEKQQELDVGILTRSSVHDLKIHESNREFFEQTEFVMLIEPSRLVTTAQLGLNSIVRYCRRNAKKQLVFCSSDKNCDGLLDALSHILMTELREVQATDHHVGTSSYMCWDGDSQHLQHRMLPNLSRYMGMGTELSFAALKNQISRTCWYGGEAFPVVDIRWIAGQYYYDLLRYADLPATQSEMDRVFRVCSDIWSAKTEENQYLTVEDENCNMFEIKRAFATRSTSQGFINVISPAYLLKDYMAANDSIFDADAKAIAYLAADYSRTNRNVALRLCLRMSADQVPEGDVVRELLLLNRDAADPEASLWHEICTACSSIGEISKDRDGAELLTCRQNAEPVCFTKAVLQKRRRYSLESGKMENFYYITDRTFKAVVLDGLQNAEYVAEDENGDHLYLGTELSGHIFQKYLPGQFFTFSGKYYQMVRMTGDGKVIVRRAADHIDGRAFYRQVREYAIYCAEESTEMGDTKDYGALRISKQYADFVVRTPAYWNLKAYNNFETGHRIEINGIPERNYRRKAMLRIDFRMQDAAPETLSALALLINETLRTMLAENADYVAVVSPLAAKEPVTYSLVGENGYIPGENSLYILEDSQLDIGLLDAVERSFERILRVICDFLAWHGEELDRSLHPEPESPKIEYEIPGGEEPKKTGIAGLIEKIKNFFKRLFKRKGSDGAEETEAGEKPKKEPFFKRLFKRRRKKDEPITAEPERETGAVPAEEPAAVPAEEPAAPEAEVSAPEAAPEQPPEMPQADESIVLFDETAGEPEQEASLTFEQIEAHKPAAAIARAPYHERHYLLYGGYEGAKKLDFAAVLTLLTNAGYACGALKEAREGRNIAEQIEKNFEPGKPGKHYCDFCGSELIGMEYEVLADGRERCRTCGRTAVKTAEDFEQIYHSVIRNMLTFYGVRITAPVDIRMVNAKKLHKALGKTFVPTGKSDGRTLGVAIRNRRGEYSILLENGSPKLQAAMTMVHELTHIWQYLNWNEAGILRTYGKEQNLEIYEGMAKWVEIQYAYLIGEPAAAKREEMITRIRDDAYGHGFVKYQTRYPIRPSASTQGETPFDNKEKPL